MRRFLRTRWSLLVDLLRRQLARRVRGALLRYVRASPTHDADPHRVVILVSSAWGMGGTIRSSLNIAGWLARLRDVEIITAYRRRDEAFFGSFPPGVRVTPLVDQRPAHAPVGAAGIAYWLLRRLPSVLYPGVDRLRKDYSLWSDVQLVRRLRGGSGILLGTRPGLNLLIAQLNLPGFIAIGQEQMNLGNHKPRVRRQIARWYPKLDGLVVLTQQDADAYDELLRGQVPVTVIPNSARPLGGPPVDPTARVAVAAGRFGKLGQKGFDLLIPAWASVAERHPDWQLRIYGDGVLRRRLEGMIEALELDDRVKLPGATDDMGQAMSEASIFVLSSRYEGFPLILLEAMSKGLACVSFDCPTGPREVVHHGENGLLVPPADVEQLADAIVEVIEDDELRRRLGEAGRVTARAFEMASIGPQWDALLTATVVPGRPMPEEREQAALSVAP